MIRVQSKCLAAFLSRSGRQCCSAYRHADDFPVPPRLDKGDSAQDLLGTPCDRSVRLAGNAIKVEQQNGYLLKRGCSTDWSGNKPAERDNKVAAFRSEDSSHGQNSLSVSLPPPEQTQGCHRESASREGDEIDSGFLEHRPIDVTI